MDQKQLKEIGSELSRMNHLLHNFIILQLIERGLGREDIKKVVRGLNNSDYSSIYLAYKRSVHEKRKE